MLSVEEIKAGWKTWPRAAAFSYRFQMGDDLDRDLRRVYVIEGQTGLWLDREIPDAVSMFAKVTDAEGYHFWRWSAGDKLFRDFFHWADTVYEGEKN